MELVTRRPVRRRWVLAIAWVLIAVMVYEGDVGCACNDPFTGRMVAIRHV